MEKGLKIPKEYDKKYSIRETERAIKYIKDTFERELANILNLERISAPLFVTNNSGLNDNLNGVERPVEFDIPSAKENVQIVHSLAKWKRYALKLYDFEVGTGLYTDMNAIRRDETLDNLHSVYVDQWDWEKVISKENRNTEFLKEVVRNIYKAFKITEKKVCESFTKLSVGLPEDIQFIDSEELLNMYPISTPKERENLIAKKYGAVFLMRIGDKLSNGEPHDGRAPDYDDWGLNGDILLWYEPLECAFELSSMGIRVDELTMSEQLKKSGCEERRELPFHKALLNGELPYTIGGGIGQSRLCMLLLKKAHIGEVQASVWPEDMKKICAENEIEIL